MGVIVQTQENKKIKYKLTEKGSQIAELLEELLEIMEKLRKIVEIEKKFKKP